MIEREEKRFVYDGSEWELTGRVASKPVFHKRDANRQVGGTTVVEIRPANLTVNDPMLNKWVNPRDLFYIQEVGEIDIESLKEDNYE